MLKRKQSPHFLTTIKQLQISKVDKTQPNFSVNLVPLDLRNWWVSRWSFHQNHLEGLLKLKWLNPTLRVSFSRSGVGPGNLHVLTISQTRLILIWGPHFWSAAEKSSYKITLYCSRALPIPKGLCWLLLPQEISALSRASPSGKKS